MRSKSDIDQQFQVTGMGKRPHGTARALLAGSTFHTSLLLYDWQFGGNPGIHASAQVAHIGVAQEIQV